MHPATTNKIENINMSHLDSAVLTSAPPFIVLLVTTSIVFCSFVTSSSCFSVQLSWKKVKLGLIDDSLNERVTIHFTAGITKK